jgi:hypothetical protein
LYFSDSRLMQLFDLGLELSIAGFDAFPPLDG